MIDIRDIYSLSDFQRNTRAHIRRLRKTRRPAVLTVNGKAELVVRDAKSYQELSAGLEVQGSAPGPRRDPPLEPDPVIEAYKEHVDRTLLRGNLERSVGERLQGLRAVQHLASEAGRAGRRSGPAT